MPLDAQYRSPWIDDELEMLAESVSRFAARELVPHREAWERAGIVSRDAWKKAGEAGILCAGIDAVYGGGGGSHAHEAVIAQELTRAGLGGSFGTGNMVSSSIVGHYLQSYGSEAQNQRWLPAMARGDVIGAIAMSEPGTGSDLQAIRTRAIATDGGWTLNGQKTFISNGQAADLIVVVARTGEAGSKGLSLLLVDATTPGFGRGRRLEKLGMHGQDTSELFFEDAFVPFDCLLGAENGGFGQLMDQLAWERAGVALDAVVNMERAVELALAYTRERMAFGKPLFAQQNTQFVLADCKAQAMAGRALFDAMMVRLLAGTLDPASAAALKLWTTDTQCKVIDACQQLFGGYGYMTEYPIARLFADARVSRIYGGSNEIMKLIVARAL